MARLVSPLGFLLTSALALIACGCAVAQPPAAGCGAATVAARTFAIGPETFLLDGQPFVIRCGEVHYTRVPPEYWRHRLQMCRAMGLNAVCVYLFWNRHEWKEGTFDWSGAADAAKFCRIAQEEGLWVVLRPGPYSCAEWEMGGLPWWLLRYEGMKLRARDPQFLEFTGRYLREVGRVFAPLQVSRGGPVLMVQVENEYGSFGDDADYLGALRQQLIDADFDVPLFACNPPAAIQNGLRDDLFQVVNFGRGAAPAFATLRKFQRTGPLMNGEFYPGWFDTWGRRHRTGAKETVLDELNYMLTHGHSFSLYMAHGGTTFGLWAGADRPFLPDTSSYDYDAPIDETGRPTEKFYLIRELVARHLSSGEKLPEVPEPMPLGSLPTFALQEAAPVFGNLPPAIPREDPATIEAIGQSRGCTLYRTRVSAGPPIELAVQGVGDFAWVYVDGKKVDYLDRRARKLRFRLPAREAESQLDILVEAMGRVNFGAEIADRKGLRGPVEIVAGAEARRLTGWEIFPLALDEIQLASLQWRAPKAGESPGPSFWRGHFDLAQPTDTFLDLSSRGKGVVWVNGHCLGRFWNIGPTQTIYCPAPWLRRGKNEVVLLDLLNDTPPMLHGREHAILDELRPELDFGAPRRASGNFHAAPGDVALQGTFTAEGTWQERRFGATRIGRYFAFEALNAIDGGAVATVAEIELLDELGQPLPRSDWRILWVDSESVAGSGGEADNVIDGQSASFWRTDDWGARTPYPHRLVIDLGRMEKIGGVRYLARPGPTTTGGRVKDFTIHVSAQPFGLVAPP